MRYWRLDPGGRMKEQAGSRLDQGEGARVVVEVLPKPTDRLDCLCYAASPSMPSHGETCRVSNRELLFALSHVPEDALKDESPKLLIFHRAAYHPPEGNALLRRGETPREKGQKAEHNRPEVGQDEPPHVADLMIVSTLTNLPQETTKVPVPGREPEETSLDTGNDWCTHAEGRGRDEKALLVV
jgi:hypothetical protein